MSYKLGRLIDHLHLRVKDLEASKQFYKAILESLGKGSSFHDGGDFFSADELHVDAAEDYVSRVHLAFQAKSHEDVNRFYIAAVAAGGTSNGAPGWRSYHDCYYAAFVLDPDGNNIEALCDAPVKRSSVEIAVERIESTSNRNEGAV